MLKKDFNEIKDFAVLRLIESFKDLEEMPSILQDAIYELEEAQEKIIEASMLLDSIKNNEGV